MNDTSKDLKINVFKTILSIIYFILSYILMLGTGLLLVAICGIGALSILCISGNFIGAMIGWFLGVIAVLLLILLPSTA